MQAVRTVTKIEANPLLTSKKNEYKQLNVAAYCRVSTDSDDQLQSYEAQVKYCLFTDLCVKIEKGIEKEHRKFQNCSCDKQLGGTIYALF